MAVMDALLCFIAPRYNGTPLIQEIVVDGGKSDQAAAASGGTQGNYLGTIVCFITWWRHQMETFSA